MYVYCICCIKLYYKTLLHTNKVCILYIVFFLIGMEHYFLNSITQNSCLRRKTVKNR